MVFSFGVNLLLLRRWLLRGVFNFCVSLSSLLVLSAEQLEEEDFICTSFKISSSIPKSTSPLFYSTCLFDPWKPFIDDDSFFFSSTKWSDLAKLLSRWLLSKEFLFWIWSEILTPLSVISFTLFWGENLFLWTVRLFSCSLKFPRILDLLSAG